MAVVMDCEKVESMDYETVGQMVASMDVSMVGSMVG